MGAFSVTTGLAKAEAQRPLRRTMGENFILMTGLLGYRYWEYSRADGQAGGGLVSGLAGGLEIEEGR